MICKPLLNTGGGGTGTNVQVLNDRFVFDSSRYSGRKADFASVTFVLPGAMVSTGEISDRRILARNRSFVPLRTV